MPDDGIEVACLIVKLDGKKVSVQLLVKLLEQLPEDVLEDGRDALVADVGPADTDGRGRCDMNDRLRDEVDLMLDLVVQVDAGMPGVVVEDARDGEVVPQSGGILRFDQS